NENIDVSNQFYFSNVVAHEFKLTGLNAKVLSRTPKMVLDKMTNQNGRYIYNASNLKVTYDETLNSSYFRYMQKYRAEPLYEAIENLCRFNPELAIPASFIGGKQFNAFSHEDLLRSSDEFESEKERWERKRLDGWEVQIDEFKPVKLQLKKEKDNLLGKTECEIAEANYVFRWVEEEDKENKKLHVYPEYYVKYGFLLYTKDEDFYKDKTLNRLDPFQREIAYVAREIFGNFIPEFLMDAIIEYFSSLTMSTTGRIVDDPSYHNRILSLRNDITETPPFKNYYNSISQVSALMTDTKALKKVK
ncbi:MAG: hypothetical protein K2G03_03955, partial [Bacilli bacterium]|nr:hypothetical protein [Bacilli bacterium]